MRNTNNLQNKSEAKIYGRMSDIRRKTCTERTNTHLPIDAYGHHHQDCALHGAQEAFRSCISRTAPLWYWSSRLSDELTRWPCEEPRSRSAEFVGYRSRSPIVVSRTPRCDRRPVAPTQKSPGLGCFAARCRRRHWAVF